MLKSTLFVLLITFLLANSKILIPYQYNLNSPKTDTLKKRHANHKKALYRKDYNVERFNPSSPDYDCVFTRRYTLEQRLKRYPFSKSARIEVVSYWAMEPRKDVSIDDTLNASDTLNRKRLVVSLNKNLPDSIFKAGIPLRKSRLNYASLIEIKQLNREQIGKLTNILYNTAFRKPKTFPDPGYTCYNPRNAFIFYDRNGKIFEYLEVCLECKHYRSLTDRISVGTGCNQKFDLLKGFLVDVGIKYGTIEKR